MIKKSQILKFPSTPGVYLFEDKAGAVLYVGKAASLKNRVGSYFRKKLTLERPIEFALAQIEKIEIKETDSVLEAYVLEQELIKKYQPKYNIIGKDDKSFCYLAITEDEFPRLEIIRQTDLNSKKHAPEKSNFPVVKPLKSPTLEMSYSTSDELPTTSYYGPFTSKNSLTTALRILQKIFPYHRSPKKSEQGCLDFQIGLCPGPYAGKISKREYQKNIHAIKLVLKGKKKILIKKLEREMKEASKKRNYEKATQKRNQLFALRYIRDTALINEERPSFESTNSTTAQHYRLEAYDISHIGGKFSVGSMIVFCGNINNLNPNKSQYRKFKIKKTSEGDDIGAMKEVLQRRLGNSWPMPDLIILDGGRGHLNMAKTLLKTLDINIPLLAVAKGPKRKKLDLLTFGPVPKLSIKNITQLRDEAHRFAITYHRKIRDKGLLK